MPAGLLISRAKINPHVRDHERVSIRPAREADLEQITAIYADAVVNGTASYELDPPDLDEMRRRYRSLAEGGFPYLVAEAAGAIAGYAYAGPFRPRPAYRFVVEDSVYVAPHAKGRGIGRALMQRLIGEAQELGLSADHRRHRRRPAGQRVGQAARGARLSPFGPA